MAADAAALAETPAKKGGGLLGLLLPLLVLTVLAAGGGGLLGTQIVGALKGSPEAAAKHEAAPPPESDLAVRELAPVVTNLAAPNDASWIRLQAAIAFKKADAPQIDKLVQQIDADILSYVRTLTVAQLQGPAGLDMLREDLAERASIRTDGHVTDVMIEMLVIQ